MIVGNSHNQIQLYLLHNQIFKLTNNEIQHFFASENLGIQITHHKRRLLWFMRIYFV